MLSDSEALLTLPGEDLRDRASGLRGDTPVHILQGTVQAAGQLLANGGLAAAGHADEQQVVCFLFHIGGNFSHPLL